MRNEIGIRCPSCLLSLYHHPEAGALTNPELTVLASLTQGHVPEIPCPCLSCTGATGRLLCPPSLTGTLGIQTPVMLARQTLYPLGYLPSPGFRFLMLPLGQSLYIKSSFVPVGFSEGMVVSEFPVDT